MVEVLWVAIFHVSSVYCHPRSGPGDSWDIPGMPVDMSYGNQIQNDTSRVDLPFTTFNMKMPTSSSLAF